MSLAVTLAALAAAYGVRAPESARTLAALSKRRPDEPLQGCLALVVNHHTWFLRDRAQLERMLDALPTDRDAHVWCAGCSTGEEAYSIALLAAVRGQRVWVTGTDVSSRVVEQARAGRYAELALRHVESDVRERFFTTSRGAYDVTPQLNQRVSFREHNLMEAALAGPGPGQCWDAIVCRNVLIHWQPDAARALVGRLETSLRDKAALFLGAADSLLLPVRRSILASTEEPPALSPSQPRDRPRAAPRKPGHETPAPRRGQCEAARCELDQGNASARARDHDQALHAYANAARIGPPSIVAEARLLMGISLRRSGEPEAALVALREATFLEPRLWQAWWALASLYASLGLEVRSASAREGARRILCADDPIRLSSDVRGLAGLDLSAHKARAWIDGLSHADVSTRGGQ